MLQDIFAESAGQLYPVGMRYVRDDMVFRYGHIHADSDVANRGRGVANIGKYGTHATGSKGYLEASAMVAANIGDTTIILTIDGIAKDEFKDGEIAIFPEVFTGIIRARVKSNLVSAGGQTVFTLKNAIPDICGAASTAKLFWNPYAYVGKLRAGVDEARFKVTQVGCLNVLTPVDHWAWLQTWGPYMGQYGGVSKPGQLIHDEDVWFDSYGAFITYACGGSMKPGLGAQRAGFVMGNRYTEADLTGAWSPWIMLQISP